MHGNDVALYRDTNDKDWIIFGDDFTALGNAPDSISNIVGASTDLPDHFAFDNLNAVPLADVFGDGVPQSGGVSSRNAVIAHYRQQASQGQAMHAPPAAQIGGAMSISAKKIDISDFLQVSQQTQILGEVPVKKILDYWMMIDSTIQTANILLAESSDQIAYGTVEAGGNTVQAVQNELYGLPVRPNLFKSYQLYLATVASINPEHMPATIINLAKKVP